MVGRRNPQAETRTGTRRSLERELRQLGSLKKAEASQWFFKTGEGQYGHGDRFLGVTVPKQRALAKKYAALSLADIGSLLKSKIHEHRLTAVFILDIQFSNADAGAKKSIYAFFLKYRTRINNWDIVDSSAPSIMGRYLLEKPRTVLYRLAKSKNIWERRIAIVATQAFIRHGQFNDTLKIAALLLHDSQDLIHRRPAGCCEKSGIAIGLF
jgi:3-methyladenine DNA glycosylase AlkD